MTTIRPAMPPMPQSAAQAGASARAAQVRAQFFQAMQASAAASQPTAVQAPVQAQAAAVVQAPAQVQPARVSQPVAGANEASPPTMRRPGSLLNILV